MKTTTIEGQIRQHLDGLESALQQAEGAAAQGFTLLSSGWSVNDDSVIDVGLLWQGSIRVARERLAVLDELLTQEIGIDDYDRG